MAGDDQNLPAGSANEHEASASQESVPAQPSQTRTQAPAYAQPSYPIAANAPQEVHKNTPTVEQLHERMSEFEKSALRWTRITVAVSIIAAIFVCFQWVEMHTGGRDTHELAEQAKQQAEQAKKQAEATESLAKAASDQSQNTQKLAESAATQAANTAKLVDASDKQEKDTERLAEASAAQAKAAAAQANETSELALDAKDQIGIMRRQLETGDRPWVKVTDAQVDSYGWIDGEAGSTTLQIEFAVEVRNAGKSPALDVNVVSEVYAPDLQKPHQAPVASINDPWPEVKNMAARMGIVYAADNLQAESDYFCNDQSAAAAAAAPPDASQAPLFPDGETQTHPALARAKLAKDQLMEGQRAQMVLIFIIGCARYHFLTSNAQHVTRFVLSLHRTGDPHTKGFMQALFPGTPVPFVGNQPDVKYELELIPRLTSSN